LYFGAQGDAGLTRGILEAALGLVFWLALGTLVVKWYDRRHFYRIQPDLLAHVSQSVEEYKTKQAAQAKSGRGDQDPGRREAGGAGGPAGTD
jgi:hypothetical protein